MNPTRVIIVEDEILIRMYMKRQLSTMNIEVIGETGNGEEALKIIPELDPDLVLLDVKIDGAISGIEVAHEMLSINPLPMAFISAYELRDTDIPEHEMILGAFQKPLSSHSIEEILSRSKDVHSK